eukprot:1296171-Amphidinium_carterae.1
MTAHEDASARSASVIDADASLLPDLPLTLSAEDEVSSRNIPHSQTRKGAKLKLFQTFSLAGKN